MIKRVIVDHQKRENRIVVIIVIRFVLVWKIIPNIY